MAKRDRTVGSLSLVHSVGSADPPGSPATPAANVAFRTFLAMALAIAVTLPNLACPVAAREPIPGKATALPPAQTGSAIALPEEPLPRGAAVRLGAPRFRHAGWIEFLSFTADGTLLISGGTDGIKIRDASTLREVRSFSGSAGGSVRAADLAPDGTLVALLDDANEGTIQIRAVANGQLVREITGWKFPLQKPVLRFSRDGKKLAGTEATQPSIAVWDLNTGAELLRWQAADKRVWTLAFTPDGKSLISGGDNSSIRFWDPASGKLQRQIGTDSGEIGRIVISPEGRRLASIRQTFVDGANAYWRGEGFVCVHDTDSGKLLRQLPIPAGLTYASSPIALGAVVFSPDGSQLLTGGGDREVRIWELATGAETRKIHDEAGIPGLLALSPDSKKLAIAPLSCETIGKPDSSRGRLNLLALSEQPVRSDWFQLFDFPSGKELVRPSGHSGGVALARFSPDGRMLATASNGSEIILWETATGKELGRLTGHRGEILAVNWADGGRKIISAATDRTLRTFDVATCKQIRQVPARGEVHVDWRNGPNGNADISADGKFLAVTDDNGLVVVTDVATGKELHSLAVAPGKAKGAFFSADAHTLFLTTTESAVNSWDMIADAESKRRELRDKRLAPFSQYYEINAARMSPDRKLLVAARVDGFIVIIDGDSERVLRSGTRPNAGNICFAISPNSRMMAWSSGRRDAGLLLIETATGQKRLRLSERPGHFLCLEFSPDGKRIVSGCDDGTALVWDLTRIPPDRTSTALNAADLESIRSDLSSRKGNEAYRAVQSLAANPNEAVPFLRKLLPPAAPVEEARVRSWIDDLGTDQPTRRDKALAELDNLGEAALPIMRQALEESLKGDQRMALEELVHSQNRLLTEPSPARLRELRVLETLELIGSPEAKKVIAEIAGGEEGAFRTELAKAAIGRLTALEANAEHRKSSK